MTKLPRDLAVLPAASGASAVALSQLDRAKEASGRLAREGDPEALHDFRVSLRRLRTCLRAYRDFLPAPKWAARWVREIARSAGAGRDIEALETYLSRLERSLRPVHGPGAARLRRRLQKRRLRSLSGDVRAARAEFKRFESELRPRLRTGAAGGSGRGFGTAAAPSIGEAAEELRSCLSEVRSVGDDDERLHRARISGKRLRYLVEPFRGERRTGRVLRTLKALQDLLGEHHDLSVFREQVGRLAERKARDEERPGLERLQTLAERRRDVLFRRFRRRWTAERTARFFGEVDRIARRLAGRGGG